MIIVVIITTTTTAMHPTKIKVKVNKLKLLKITILYHELSNNFSSLMNCCIVPSALLMQVKLMLRTIL